MWSPRTSRTIFFSVVLSHTLFVNSYAQDSAVYQMERDRLLNPEHEVIEKEHKNHLVHIYEGMTLSDVNQAMDGQFDRIDNMMFILTRLPPTAAGGEETVEEDGCD